MKIEMFSAMAKKRLHLIVALIAATAFACDRGGKAGMPGPTDSGVVEQIACTMNSDCPPANLCSDGFCEPVIGCNVDDDCAAVGKVCHSTRGFCVECDGKHENECPMGQTCQFDFTCVGAGGSDGGVGDASTCSGTCSTRDDCDTGLVCSGNSCCPPPARCVTADDCPANSPECNAATGLCFGGDSCLSDQDCVDKPGCPGSLCACDQVSAGQPGTCRPRSDECQSDQDCLNMGAYDGKYCAVRAQPKTCLEAPTCTEEIDCAQFLLVCDQMMGSASQGRCVNGAACPMGNECPANQTCQDGQCVGQNCINTPNLCGMGENCNTQTGRCEMGGNTSCTDNSDCPQGQYCNTSANVCLPGCRDNSDCPMGAICDANNQCVQQPGGYCGPCQTDADCPGGLSCGLISQQCKQRCQSASDCTFDPSASCTFFFCSCGP